MLLFLYITLHYDWVSFLFKLLKAVSVCRNTAEPVSFDQETREMCRIVQDVGILGFYFN